MEHAAILARGGTIMPEHLPPSAPSGMVAQGAEVPMDQQIQTLLTQWTARQLREEDHGEQLYEKLLALVEPPVLQTVVDSQAGQLVASARILGLHRTTLRKKIDQHQGERDDSS